jgi:hypothetical protein
MAGDGPSFDEAAVIKDLRAWWNDQVAGAADDPFASPALPKGTIFDVLPAVDSLGVVSGLVTTEKHVGMKIPARVIRRGGYKDFDEMTADLLPKVKALVEKSKAKPSKGSKKEAA